MAAYQWKIPGLHAGISADIAGKVCEDLEYSGKLTPRNLVSVSKPEDAPLHDAFEWNDEAAAQKYREVQAGGIIRNLVVLAQPQVADCYDEDTPVVRAFVSVKNEGRSQYERIVTVMGNAQKRKQLLLSARRDMEAFRAKYNVLCELGDVLSAMDWALLSIPTPEELKNREDLTDGL